MNDYRKAFDYVNYDNLWHRRITTGVMGRMLTIIKSMYRQLKFHVRDFMGEICDQFTGQKFHHYEFTPSEKYRIWLQLIEPILLYGSEVWGHVKAGLMEIMHRRFLREILGVRTGTRINLLYHELGTILLKSRRELKMVRFWVGVAQETSDKLSSRVYKLQVRENRRNWPTRERDVLTKYDHAHVWLNGPPPKTLRHSWIALRQRSGRSSKMESGLKST